LAPGLSSLSDFRDFCTGQKKINISDPLILPAPAALPSNERRRSSRPVRLTLACLEQLVLQGYPLLGDLRSVFATDDGVGEINQQIFDVLATTRQISPLVFPNSVHSAVAGYFSIAHKNQKSATHVSRGVESFAAGLLCAVTDAFIFSESILFVCFDPAMTDPMHEVLPITQPTASVWLISSGESSGPLVARFTLVLESDNYSGSPLPSWLPQEWVHNSTAYGYGALNLIEQPPGSFYRLQYGVQTLRLSVIECE
jgi:hypothetical protein